MMNLVSRYFAWLQKDNPTGLVDSLPEIDERGETSVKGIYVIGDLTGIPLLKLAAESGKDIMETFAADQQFQTQRKSMAAEYDIVIVGGGISGISAAIEASRLGYRFVVIESAQTFSTVANFPKGKPIYSEPASVQQRALLKIHDGTKESLLEDMHEQIATLQLPVREGEMVETINKRGELLEVVSKRSTYSAYRVILAIGKSGNARMLGVEGEHLPKVYNRLFDPRDHHNEEVLVVGGGDSAIETANAIAEVGNHVTISYRKAEFARPKEGNVEKLTSLVNAGTISLLMESEVKEIRKREVQLKTRQGEKTIKNDAVYAMIGRELPLDFFRRSGIRLSGELTRENKLWIAFTVLFSCVVYFGKSSDLHLLATGVRWDSHAAIATYIFSTTFWSDFLSLPATIVHQSRDWASLFKATVALVAFVGTLCMSAWAIVFSVRRASTLFATSWNAFKYSYFAVAMVLFCTAFFGSKYFDYHLLGRQPSFWYTFLYTTTIIAFGMRRMYVKPTRYIKRQTWSLILIQAFPLFLLPEIILPAMHQANIVHPWLIENLFPPSTPGSEPTFWRAYGLILAWPLFISNLVYGLPTTAWLVISLVQTFVLIPLIVLKWGKGAYCGWICSCGAMAETLGDEYRKTALHGPVPKKWENLGQGILGAIVVVTTAALLTSYFGKNTPWLNFAGFVTQAVKAYSIIVDIIFAGVLGVGVYFFFSGRVWCRFMCPLAALMQIYARFTRYRIFADKKKCISCNICTGVCHMGIDVMSFANKGIPMNDVECVRCSACVVHCPMEVLSFGELPKSDPNNTLYHTMHVKDVMLPKLDWRCGL
jgi:NosR/NirI family transcriptional regulator, nitrous oxide reductase regulator